MPLAATQIAGLVFIGVCVLGSVLSNLVFGRGIGDVSCGYRIRFSPSARAFSIWGVIYALALGTVLEQALGNAIGAGSPAPTLANGCYALAWLCAAAWTPCFTARPPGGLVAAAFALTCTAALSLTAVLTGSVWRVPNHEARRWVTGSAFSTLAGWTCVASALNAAIAFKALQGEPAACKYPDGYDILSPMDAADATPVPLILSFMIGTLSILTRDPVLPLPVLWALWHMRPSWFNYTAFGLLGVCACVALARAYAQF